MSCKFYLNNLNIPGTKETRFLSFSIPCLWLHLVDKEIMWLFQVDGDYNKHQRTSDNNQVL